ncbi:hypothetical protein BGZ98_009621 [Dissophora globulifera]|nr:hypothetical protein BGZ98_009621 [Dissophora globulifera]
MELPRRAHSLLQECNDIIASLETWKDINRALEIDGLQKMTSALHSERKFLEKVASTAEDEIKPVQITSSNVPYLKSLVWALINSKNPIAVRKTFTYALDPFTIIEPSEKFKALPKQQGQTGLSGGAAAAVQKGRSVMQLSTSQPLSTTLSNEQTFQVKVDVVADHGKSWLRINAGSVWSLIHEFSGMEDDSDDEKEDENEDESAGNCGGSLGHIHSRKKPIHVSKQTHPDMALLTRSLVLAADQNRLHYTHRPKITLRFAGILPGESLPLEAMIHKSVEVGRVAQSIQDNTVESFPVEVVFGPFSLPSNSSQSPLQAAAVGSMTPLDPLFAPFSIPKSVDDMVLFTKRLHLDITTLMALSSFLCHTIRPDPALFTSPPLILQAQQEHDQPLLPLLAKIFAGRERIVICRTSATRFKEILDVIGGPEEKWRGKAMIHDPLEDQESAEDETSIKERWVRNSEWARQYGVFADGPPRIEVIEDILETASANEEQEREQKQSDNSPSGRGDIVDSSRPLNAATSPSGSVPTQRELNMTELHTKIFLTGYNGRLTTLTANQVGFRTVTRMGQVPAEMSIWNHSPRSLAEAKLQS